MKEEFMNEPMPKSIFKAALPKPHRKTDRTEKMAKYQADLSGSGKYIFQNNTKGELHLPRPTTSGVKRVRVGETFEGDSYYFQLVKTNELKFIEEVHAMEQKLITEQPPTVTPGGTVEYVREQEAFKKMNEEEKDHQNDILLTEQPMDGIKIIS
jgi:hypothetical protein